MNNINTKGILKLVTCGSVIVLVATTIVSCSSVSKNSKLVVPKLKSKTLKEIKELDKDKLEKLLKNQKAALVTWKEFLEDPDNSLSDDEKVRYVKRIEQIKVIIGLIKLIQQARKDLNSNKKVEGKGI